MANLLLKNGAVVDGRVSAAEPTPLMVAAYNGHLEMVKLFLEDYNADASLIFVEKYSNSE